MVLLLLGAALALGILFRGLWLEMEVYTALRPAEATRTLGLALLGLSLVALPWAALRSAAVWRQFQRDGHLEEYRRSRLSPASIVLGMAAAALAPLAALLGLSLALSAGISLLGAGLSLAGVAWAHALLAAQAAAFGALGLWLSARLRHPGLAVPAALGVLAGAVGAIAALDPFLRGLEDPAPWIYAALLPNPVTAVGNALETDVLRFSWLYARLHAHEYFFVYPPAWQTAGLYVGAAAVFLALTGRRVAGLE